MAKETAYTGEDRERLAEIVVNSVVRSFTTSVVHIGGEID